MAVALLGALYRLYDNDKPFPKVNPDEVKVNQDILN